MYRGPTCRRCSRGVDDVLALVASAAFFAAIHFAPVEFPGLLAFGIVLGLCFQRTGRIGMPIAAHIGFNAMGLVIAAT